jgi:hypothetical protein
MVPERSALYMSPRLLYCDSPARESSLDCICSFELSVFALLMAARSVSPAACVHLQYESANLLSVALLVARKLPNQ